MAFGTGLHPTTRLCLAALESLADRGVLTGGASTAARPACSTSAAAPGSSSIAAGLLGAREVLAVDVDPIAVEAIARERPAQPARARVITAREGSAPSGEGPFDVVLANLIAVAADHARRRAGRGRPARRHAARVGDLREPRGGGRRRRSPAAACASRTRWAEGDWVALELARPADPPRRCATITAEGAAPPRYDRADRCPTCRRCFPLILATHITLAIACSCRACCCRSRSATGSVNAGLRRAADRAGSSGSLLWLQAHGTIVIGAGPRAHRARDDRRPRPADARAAVAARQPRDLRDHRGRRVRDPAADAPPARAPRPASRPTPTARRGGTGPAASATSPTGSRPRSASSRS